MVVAMRIIRRRAPIVVLGLLLVFSGFFGYRGFTVEENKLDERSLLAEANQLLDKKEYLSAIDGFQRIQDAEPFNSRFDAAAFYNTAHTFWVMSDTKPLLHMRHLYIEALRIQDDEDTRKNLEIVTRLLQKAQSSGSNDLDNNGDYGVGDDTSGF